MVYPMGIMGGLRSPFASSIRQAPRSSRNVPMPFPVLDETMNRTPSLNPIDAKGNPIRRGSVRRFPSIEDLPVGVPSLNPIDDRGMPIVDIGRDRRRPVPMPIDVSIRQPRMLPNNSSLPIRRGGEDQDGPVDPYARPTPDMLPQPIEINPNYRPNLPYRPNPNLPFNGNPNMYQRPMRRPFGFGGRPMNSFMGMGLGMMNPMGMGMFGGFPMRPPMFGGYGGGYGGGYNMMRPPMGFGLGGANPYGMNPYSNFGRPNPYPQPSVFSEYNMPRPYNSGMNFNQPHVMQQQQGGYGSYQQPSGYGNYGGMQNPYQPQQMGNTNNFAGYGQQQAMF